MQYKMSLSFNNRREVLDFPVLPETLEFREKGKSKTYDIVGGLHPPGQGFNTASVYQGRDLTSVTFSSIFPEDEYPFVTTESLKSPEAYLEQIFRWMGRKEPKRFIFYGEDSSNRRFLNINFPVTIEQFDWKAEAGTNDIAYTLTLRRYAFYAARKAVFVTDEEGNPSVREEAPARMDERVRPDSYTLKAGDNLWKVAKSLLGDGSRWKEIQTLNGLTDAELTRLPVGLTLKIPQE